MQISGLGASRRTAVERIAVVALRVLIIGPAIALGQLLVKVVSGEVPLSGTLLWQVLSLSLAVFNLVLCSLEVTEPRVSLTGFWKPSTGWLWASPFIIALGMDSLLSRNDSSGWLVLTYGLLALTRCVRDLKRGAEPKGGSARNA